LPQAVLAFERDTGLGRGELHNVRLPDEAESERLQPQPAHDPHARPILRPGLMRPLMQTPPLGRELILRPNLLQMNECHPSLAENEVRKGRYGEKILF
jgi:hypothetical protein